MANKMADGGRQMADVGRVGSSRMRLHPKIMPTPISIGHLPSAICPRLPAIG